jgi:trk system potassium uptake protein TrkA
VFVLIVGAGRVGSAVAKSALAAGHEVSVLDEDPLSHERLDAGQSRSWEESDGQFTVGTALETDALIQAGIERADVFIASTDGDNTNLIIAQIAQRRFGVDKVLVRVMDPARAGTANRDCTRSRPPSTRSKCSRARSRSRGSPAMHARFEMTSKLYSVLVKPCT